MDALGAYRGCFALREARHGAGRRGAQTRQFHLPGGSRDPDAAGSVEQRTLLVETERGPADQMRVVPGGERWTGVEGEVLSGGDSFAAPLHVQGSLRDSAAPTG